MEHPSQILDIINVGVPLSSAAGSGAFGALEEAQVGGRRSFNIYEIYELGEMGGA